MKVCPSPRFVNSQNKTLHHILLVYTTHRTQVMSAILISPLFPGGVQIAFLQLVLLWSKQATNKKNGQVVLVCIILTRLPVDGFSSVLVTYHLTLVLSQSVTSVRSRSRRTNSLYNAARVTICIT